MQRIEITKRAHNVLLLVSKGRLDGTGIWLNNGNVVIDLQDSTLEALCAAMLEGETYSETIERIYYINRHGVN